jgi:hypothetical protein
MSSTLSTTAGASPGFRNAMTKPTGPPPESDRPTLELSAAVVLLVTDRRASVLNLDTGC